MRGVRPVQLRQGPDGTYQGHINVEHEHARFDADYNAVCLFLREQPLKITGSPPTVTRISPGTAAILTEASNPLSIGVDEFAVNYTTGMIFLNNTSVTGTNPVSTEVYKTEYTGLGTLVSTRDILGKTYTPMVSISSASPVTRFALEQEFTVKRAHIPVEQITIPQDTHLASTTVSGMLLVLYNDSGTIKYKTIGLDQGLSESTSSWVVGTYVGTTSLPGSLTSSSITYFKPVSLNTAILIANKIVYTLTLEGDSVDVLKLIDLNTVGLKGVPSISPTGDGSFLLTYLQALSGETAPNFITTLFYSVYSNMPYEQTVLASSTTFSGGDVAIAIPSVHGLTIVVPYIDAPDLVVDRYRIDSYAMPSSPTNTSTHSGSTKAYTSVSFHGVGPAGEIILSALRGASSDEASILSVSDSGVINDKTIPLDDVLGETILSAERFQAHYIVHTINTNAVLTSHLVNAINFSITTSQTKIDLTTDSSGITDPSNLAAGILSSGGWYTVIFFQSNATDPDIHSVWYAKFSLDEFIEWGGTIDGVDLSYIDASSSGQFLELSTSSSDMLTVAEGDTSVVTATVSVVGMNGAKASYSLNATYYNNSGTLEEVQSTVDVLSSTAGAVTDKWMARLNLDSNEIGIEVFGNGSTASISFEATGKLFR